MLLIPTNLRISPRMKCKKKTVAQKMAKISIRIDCGNFRTDCSEMM